MMRTLHPRWAALVLLATLVMWMTPISAQIMPDLPLAGTGPYMVGFKIMQFKDASRDGRSLYTYVWYPAIAPEKPTNLQSKMHTYGWLDARPDTQAAPYPLILVSPGQALSALEYTAQILSLTSHGFVVAGLTHPNEQDPLSLVDRPVDILFVLNQLTVANQSNFGGLIDTDHVGVMGHSYGGYTTLAVTGARINPASAKAWGTQPVAPAADADPRDIWFGWNWDKLALYRTKISPLGSSELWPAFSDKRILATIVFAPCDIPMFGERGLAAATVPTLIVAGTSDPICLYEADAAYAFAHLGSQEHYLLSVIQGSHESFQNTKLLPIITHLETAFFGYYLRGQKDYAHYLTAAYIDAVEAQDKLGLVWGLTSDK